MPSVETEVLLDNTRNVLKDIWSKLRVRKFGTPDASQAIKDMWAKTVTSSHHFGTESLPPFIQRGYSEEWEKTWNRVGPFVKKHPILGVGALIVVSPLDDIFFAAIGGTALQKRRNKKQQDAAQNPDMNAPNSITTPPSAEAGQAVLANAPDQPASVYMNSLPMRQPTPGPVMAGLDAAPVARIQMNNTGYNSSQQPLRATPMNPAIASPYVGSSIGAQSTVQDYRAPMGSPQMQQILGMNNA